MHVVITINGDKADYQVSLKISNHQRKTFELATGCYADHYHGILMIRKENKDTFYKRAIKEVRKIFYAELSEEREVLHLQEKIINQVRSKSAKDSHYKEDLSIKYPLPLRAYSVDLRKLETENDCYAASKYCTKGFAYNFTYDDVMLYSPEEMKLKSSFLGADVH